MVPNLIALAWSSAALRAVGRAERRCLARGAEAEEVATCRRVPEPGAITDGFTSFSVGEMTWGDSCATFCVANEGSHLPSVQGFPFGYGAWASRLVLLVLTGARIEAFEWVRAFAADGRLI